MTLPASGPISLSDLNGEFGNAGTDQISFSQAFGGTYAQYGAINRNTTAGQSIYSVNVGATNFALTTFYSYNDTATVLWSYAFINNSSNDVNIIIEYNAAQLYNARLDSSTSEDVADVDTTTSSASSLADITLSLNTGDIPNYVDINCYDPDTSATIYQVTGDSPNNYGGGAIGQIYGYQRFVLDLTFYD